MKTPWGSAVQGAQTPPCPLAQKRPSVLGEGKFCNLAAMWHLRTPPPSYRSSPRTATARRLTATDRRETAQDLDVLLMPQPHAASARHPQQAHKPFGYSILAAGARPPACSTATACIAESPTTTTPPSTKRMSLQAPVPCTGDLTAGEIK